MMLESDFSHDPSPALDYIPTGWPDDAPPRSILFNVAPLGLDGSSTEELRSYYRRLCAAHGIRPWTMTQYVVIPSGKRIGVFGPGQRAEQTWNVDAIGCGSQAVAWSKTLDALTKREDLNRLTLLSLGRFLPHMKLLSQENRFCPHCYAEDIAFGRPTYDRLIWTISALSACPIHRCRLITDSPPRRGMSAHRDLFRPGLSRYTGDSLAERTTVPATQLEVSCARKVAALLDDALFLTESSAQASDMSRFVNIAIQALFKGISAHFADHLGISKSQVHGWSQATHRPSLPRLIQIALACDCNISDIVLGNNCDLTKMPKEAFTELSIAPRHRTGPTLGMDSVMSGFKDVLSERPDITFRQMAKALDVSEKYLRRVAPSECAALVEGRRDALKLTAEERERRQDLAYQAAHDELLRQGISPTRRNVMLRVHASGDESFRFKDWHRAYQRANEKRSVPPRMKAYQFQGDAAQM